MIFPPASTSKSVQVFFCDDSGLALTGKVAADFPTTSYQLAGANALAGITLSDLAALTSVYSSGGVKEIGAGYYRLDLPNAALATAGVVAITGEASGKHVILVGTIDVGGGFTGAPGTLNGPWILGTNIGTTTLTATAGNNTALTINGTGTGDAVLLNCPGVGVGFHITSLGNATYFDASGGTAVAMDIRGGAGNTALTLHGNGAAPGLQIFSGSGASADAVQFVAQSTSGHGFKITAAGTGHGILATSGSGATGDGMHLVSAATAGDGFKAIGNGTGYGMEAVGGGSGSQVSWPTSSGSSGSIHTGTATGGSSTTIALDAGASTVTNSYVGSVIGITSLTGVGQVRAITAYNTGTKTCTVDQAWDTTPDATSVFAIFAIGRVQVQGTTYTTLDSLATHGDATWTSGVSTALRTGTAQAGASTTITLDAGASANNNAYVGATIGLITGTGAGQSSRITSYVGATKVATVYAAWGTNPASDTTFVVTPSAPVSIYTMLASAAAKFFTLDSGTTFSSAVSGSVVKETAANAGSPAIRSNTAQAGASTTITLDAAASATNNLYVGETITLTGGTGAGQTQSIKSYVGSSKIATIAGTWATNPDATSTFTILPATPPTSIAAAVWDYLTTAIALTGSIGKLVLSKLLLINAGSNIELVNPVDSTGVIHLIQGIANLYASGTGIIFNIDGTVTDLTGITVKLGLTNVSGGSGTATLTVTGTVHDAGLVTQSVSFNLTSAQTAALDADPSEPHPFRSGGYAYKYVLLTGATASNCVGFSTGDVSVTANTIACT